MRRTTALVAALLAITLGGFAADGFAQGVQTGSIRGTVTDQQNLPVPGVTITVQSPALQGVRSTASAGDGTYAFVALPPGTYEMTFEISSFAPVKRSTNVLLGLAVEQNVTLRAAGVAEEVSVVAAAPAPIVNPTVGANYRNDEINALATPRTLQGIAQLAPGLTENTPNAGQVTINGSMAFDNIFMLNGVDVNDNLFGSPQSLFIEDAIEETQILTSGITAEYGRFTGGVVNAITKSGGNTFSGSWRTNFINPAWTDETPFETCDPAVTAATCRPAPARKDDVQLTYEGTLGGPIVRDKLWFFGAARFAKTDTVGTLPFTNLSNTQTDDNKRAEIKLTGTAASNHTIQGGYLSNSTEQASRPTFGFTIDKQSVGNRTLPNWFAFANYRGIVRSNLLVEAQFSQRKFQFKDSGGSSTNIVDSPILTLTQTLAHYNAQYFDATDPENRNNRQLTGNLTYFLEGGDYGRHELKAGYEFFRSQRTGGNSQSSTGYVFEADYAVDASGNPVFDANGFLRPVFVPGETLLQNWLPVRGATLNVDNNSIFAQDHWVINNQLSADIGLRYENVRSEATGNIIGLDHQTFVPRLALAYDVQGNGKHIIHGTYGWYSGRAAETQAGENSNVGTPDFLYSVYTGPAGQGRNFAPGFNLSNYELFFGEFPTANVKVSDDLRTALVKEFSASYGADLLNGRGYGEVTYVHRDASSLFEDFIMLQNGTTTIVRDGVDFGTFTNTVIGNSDEAFREYRGFLFQGRYNIMSRWTVNAHYTVQLRNHGNYEGEGTNTPGAPGLIGDYPELRSPQRHWPSGRLNDFQRHKLRAWTIYNFDLGRAGDLGVSGLLRVDSALTYSLAASSVPLTSIQRSLISGYVDEPGSQTTFFADRGSEFFKGFGLVDVSFNYQIPVFRTLRPWVKLDIFNALNNQKLIQWNTTVTPDPASPTDALGLRTGFRQGSLFGKATATTHFPTPFQGNNGGGRTLRMAVGFRF
jgi:hypothetical protein